MFKTQTQRVAEIEGTKSGSREVASTILLKLTMAHTRGSAPLLAFNKKFPK